MGGEGAWEGGGVFFRLTKVQSCGPLGQLFMRWPVARQEKQNLFGEGGIFEFWEVEGVF